MKPTQLSHGAPLEIEDISLEGFLGVIWDSKTGETVGYYQIRNGIQVEISKEECEQIRESQKGAK